MCFILPLSELLFFSALCDEMPREVTTVSLVSMSYLDNVYKDNEGMLRIKTGIWSHRHTK